MKKIITVLLSTLILLNSVSTEVFAAESPVEQVAVLESTIVAYEGIGGNARSTTFTDTSIDIYCSSIGMEVTIYSITNHLCSVVGVKDVEVQLKNGNDWVTVAVSGPAEDTNTHGMGMTFTYEDAIYGATYRIHCVHYANGDEYRELEHTTSEFKFIY